MSSPSGPSPTGEDSEAAQPSTREIPVVPAAGQTAPAPAAAPTAPPLPPHPGALPPAPVVPPAVPPATAGQAPAQDATLDLPRETGPVDFVPGLPGVGSPAPPLQETASEPTGASTAARSWPDTLEADAPATPPRARAPQDRATLLGVGLAVLALVLLELGLGLDFGGRSLWSLVPLWSAFATVAALLALVGVVPATSRGGSGLSWRIAAAGLVGLAVFWLLVVLPHADTNRGFVLTAALGALGAGLWMGPGRSR